MALCRTSWKSKGKKKKDDKSQKLDLYALLGLQNERWTATEAQIKLGEGHWQQLPCILHPHSAHLGIQSADANVTGDWRTMSYPHLDNAAGVPRCSEGGTLAQ